MNPMKPIIKVNPNQELDTDEVESTKDEEESTTSTELSEQNSTSDTPTQATEDSKATEIPQGHNVLNKTKHDEDDSSEHKDVNEFEPTKENGEQNIGKENKLLSTNFEVKIENQKVEWLITYSLDQQIFKFTQRIMGSLVGLMIQLKNFNLIQTFDDHINKLLYITPQISSTHNLLVNKHTTQWGEGFDFIPMKRHLKSWNPEG